MNSKKRCKKCKKYFKVETMFITNMGNFCGNECRMEWSRMNLDKIIEKAKKQRVKKERKERQQRKYDLKPDKEIKHYIQKEYFNKYICLRDSGEPCPTCGTRHSKIWDAGHFISVGSADNLRFHEDNVHRQCRHCNYYGNDNQGKYRDFLVNKIGEKRVQALENGKRTSKWSREQLEQIKEEYKNKIKQLKLEREK